MPKNVMCKKCNNLKNAWCEKVIDSPDPDMARDCRHFWEKTNADCIRAENDDGLKETIHAFSLGFKPWCDFHCENEGDDGCDKCIENWLKQPARENDYG